MWRQTARRRDANTDNNRKTNLEMTKLKPAALESHYYDGLVEAGWEYEGVGWMSADASTGVPLYRQYNPYAVTGTHNYTTSKSENDHLVSVGWREEGVGWYGV